MYGITGINLKWMKYSVHWSVLKTELEQEVDRSYNKEELTENYDHWKNEQVFLYTCVCEKERWLHASPRAFAVRHNLAIIKPCLKPGLNPMQCWFMFLVEWCAIERPAVNTVILQQIYINSPVYVASCSKEYKLVGTENYFACRNQIWVPYIPRCHKDYSYANTNTQTGIRPFQINS